MKLKILCIVPSYKPAYVYGGPTRVIASLCESLVQAGHLVNVYTTNANGKTELDVIPGKEYIVNGVPVVYHNRITKDHSNYSPSLLRRLRKNMGSFDIIHIHSWWNMVAIPAAWICMNRNISPVITLHGTLSAFTFAQSKQLAKRLIHKWIGRKLLKFATIHSTSTKEHDEISQFISNDSGFIIPNVIDLPQELKGVYTGMPYLRFIFVGRINPVKNLERILEILTEKVTIPYQISIIGDGEDKYVNHLKSISGSHQSIQWLGPIDGDEKYKILCESDVLILPSHTENAGIVVFEALSQGTGVIVSEYVGAKEYILNNDFGWVVNDNDEAWQEIFSIVWTQKEKRNDIRHRAPDIVRRDFNKKIQVASYIDMYQKHLTPLN